MRDVFWPSVIPISKQEIVAKGLLPHLAADTPRKDKDEWVLCSVIDEGAGCDDGDFIEFDLFICRHYLFVF
jgi:hypothetical protein